MAKLSQSTSSAIRTFSFWLANRTVGLPLLEGVDYSCIFEEPSALEQTYAIFRRQRRWSSRWGDVDAVRLAGE